MPCWSSRDPSNPIHSESKSWWLCFSQRSDQTRPSFSPWPTWPSILTDQKNYQNINAESALFTLSCFLIVWGQEWWVRFVLILLSSTCNFLLYEVKSGGGERENIFWFLNEKKYMYMIQYNFFLILDFLIVWGQERWGKGNICFF